MSCAIASIIIDHLHEDETLFAREGIKQEFLLFYEDYYLKNKPKSTVDSLLQSWKSLPQISDIQEFIWILFDFGKIKPEIAIIMLIYLQRLKVYKGVLILRQSWRPLVLISTMSAEKVWSDIPLSNKDFSTLYPFFSVEDLKKMEAEFLKLLNFEVQVSQKLYTEYYFNLSTLVNQIEIPNPFVNHKVKSLARSKAEEDEEESVAFDVKSEVILKKNL
eukprot:TRINITY_DN10835_c0_g1_i2.p1 TRINITY_DN10835_c0_g1~~TRINITY_DN10835_c0_g1_i2.p1  ORF type:complete len:218 (-),score=36.51 TRINITY_DN10835_c0_g1_i2:138-791(-)